MSVKNLVLPDSSSSRAPHGAHVPALAPTVRTSHGNRHSSRERAGRGSNTQQGVLPSFGTLNDNISRAPMYRNANMPGYDSGNGMRSMSSGERQQNDAGRHSVPGIRKRGSSSGKGKRLWTSEEDELLKRLAGSSPENWNLISTSLDGRTGKQCRERWLNHLRPDIRKGSWTQAEDNIILREQAVRGNCWSDIARLLPGRSDNAVKNRYNATLKRLKRSR